MRIRARIFILSSRRQAGGAFRSSYRDNAIGKAKKMNPPKKKKSKKTAVSYSTYSIGFFISKSVMKSSP